MKVNKIILTALCVAAFGGSSALAADATLNRANNSINVSGRAKPDEIISVICIQPGYDVSNITNVAQLKAAAGFFGETKADDDGNYSIDVYPGDTSGKCSIFLNGDTVHEKLFGIDYISKAETDVCLLRLQTAATAANNAEACIQTELSDAALRNVLGIDDVYAREAFRNEMFAAIKAKQTFTAIDDLDDALSAVRTKISLLDDINNMINKAQVKDNLARLYMLLGSEDDAYRAYKRISRTDSVDSAIYQGRPYTSLEAVADALKRAIAAGTNTGNASPKGGTSGNRGNGVYYPPSENPTDTDNKDDVAPLPPKSGFSDVPDGHWAAEAVKTLSEKGIVSGRAVGEFVPDKPVKREEFVKMLICAMDVEIPEAADGFSDTDGTAWYSKYLAAAQEIGLIAGREDGSFGIGESLMRQDMALILKKAFEYKGVYLESIHGSFTDQESFADYAKDSIAALAGAGILNGMEDGSFAPKNNTTRAQAALVIFKFLNREV